MISQYILTVLVFLVLLVVMICLGRQPITEERLSFKVPVVPWLPMFSVFVNVYLMMKLSEATWVRFAVWLVLGVLVPILLNFFLPCCLVGRCYKLFTSVIYEYA
jgi:hypothetical protein